MTRGRTIDGRQLALPPAVADDDADAQPALTVLPTIYAGHRFRSRTEARWAVFFDALGVPWEYEPEAFQLSDGRRYLPDFYLPTIRGGCWFEVKGRPPAKPQRCDNGECCHCDAEPEGCVRYRRSLSKVFVLGLDSDKPAFLAWGRVGVQGADAGIFGSIESRDGGNHWFRLCPRHQNYEIARAWMDGSCGYYPWEFADPRMFTARDRANTYRFWDPK